MCPRGTNIGASVTCSVCQVPALTLIAIAPASSSHRETCTHSSSAKPPGDGVLAVDAPDQRQPPVATIARATSRLKRARFSSEPP